MNCQLFTNFFEKYPAFQRFHKSGFKDWNSLGIHITNLAVNDFIQLFFFIDVHQLYACMCVSVALASFVIFQQIQDVPERLWIPMVSLLCI
ncbi:unnamed protein product [Ixodes persulcatus]